MPKPEPDSIDYLERIIRNHNFATYDFHSVGDTVSTLTDEQHKANIRRGIAHCRRGDVFQIVLSRRFVQRYEGDDFKLYRALRSITEHVMLVDRARNDLSRNCYDVKVEFYKDMQYYSHVIHLVSRVCGVLDDLKH